MWYDVVHQERGDDQTLSAEVHVPNGSEWFNGHFPGHPVLPGIAQLGMVFDVIRHSFAGPLRVTAVSRVRFKQMILPDDHLNVSATPRPAHEGSYAFRITKGDELVCSGTMAVQEVQEK